ncbi:hypothetical protein Gotur_002176 [Gossypium turneri]
MFLVAVANKTFYCFENEIPTLKQFEIKEQFETFSCIYASLWTFNADLTNVKVERLMMDIAAAEEEITRWKSVAEQEAAAGRAVEQEFLAQLLKVFVVAVLSSHHLEVLLVWNLQFSCRLSWLLGKVARRRSVARKQFLRKGGTVDV